MMIIGQLYVVRDRTTGFYMPEPTGRMGRGGSHLEPEDPTKCKVRTFHSHQAARSFIGQWVRGTHTVDRYYDGETGHHEEGNVTVTPIPHRRKDNLEIVPIDLVTQF